ncbi:ATP-dependent Clp protease adapter protein CLPS2, chloroplastic-like [Diospyros lotus]|uniref:ATP-dependent Clp protease adapter protein CLPS2, chloroplastic-like n=1 Tax=Diospyros lotus TaxID=55363 RepID=UPI00224E2965|nr:ATP-dependent Clp protease adapter protein CLPS2, chloroplastic-like [Diospyros lotus]
MAAKQLLYLPSFPPSSCSSPSIFKSSKCLVPLKVSAESTQKEIRFCAVSCASIMASLGSKKGGAAILERPTFDQSQFDPSTQVEEGGDIGRLRDRRGAGSGDSYRVLLIDDMRHSEKLVVKVLPQVVPSVTPDNARKLFHQSRENGVAVVIVTVKEHAEFYAQMMIRGGLRSLIEPDSSTV